MADGEQTHGEQSGFIICRRFRKSGLTKLAAGLENGAEEDASLLEVQLPSQAAVP